MKVGFNPKWGYTEIDIPITDKTKPIFTKSDLSDLWNKKVTIYNDIPATSTESRHFDRFVVEKCNIQGGFVSKADGTIENVANAQTVISKDIKRYKDARAYAQLPVDLRSDFFTARIGDFIVYGEVDDIVTDSASYLALQKKYAENGFKITSVNATILGMDVDNITFTNA